MKVYGITDLHLDINPLVWTKVRDEKGNLTHHQELDKVFNKPLVTEDHKNDILLLGGDTVEIGNTRPNYVEGMDPFQARTMTNLKAICEAYRYVVMIPGNHEFYHGNFFQAMEEFRARCAEIPNLKIIDNDVVDIDGLKIIGTMLWTDMRNDDPLVKQVVSQSINDYFLVTYHTDRLHPNDTVEMHRLARNFIVRELDKVEPNKRTIVMTHMAPIFQHANGERYGHTGMERLVDYYYACTDMDDVILDNEDKVEVWFHGHTHDRRETQVGNTRVLTHARGYDHQPFDPILIMDDQPQ